MLAGERGLAEQLKRERGPELILVEIAGAFAGQRTANIDLRFCMERVAVYRDEDVFRHR
ncbi:hypothetical protein [Afipia felis]